MNDDSLLLKIEDSLFQSCIWLADEIRKLEGSIGQSQDLLNDYEIRLDEADDPAKKREVIKRIEELNQHIESKWQTRAAKQQELIDLANKVNLLREMRQEKPDQSALSAAGTPDIAPLAPAVGFSPISIPTQTPPLFVVPPSSLSQIEASAAFFEPDKLLPFKRPRVLPYVYEDHHQPVYRVAWSPDGPWIASGGADGQVRIWDAATGETLFPSKPGPDSLAVPGHTRAVRALAWSSDGTYLASANIHIVILNTLTWEGRAFPHGPPEVTTLAWEPNGARLIAVREASAEIWDTRLRKKISTYRHSQRIRALAWHPRDKRIASVSEKIVLVWSPAEIEEAENTLHSYRTHKAIVTALAWSPDGEYIAAGKGDFDQGMLEVWDTPTQETKFTAGKHAGPVTALAWSPRGDYIATGSQDSTVKIWDATTGVLVYTYTGHSKYVLDLAWSPDGEYIASAGMDHSVQVWRPIYTDVYRV